MVIYNKVTGLIKRVIHPDDMIEAYRDYYKDDINIEIIPENYQANPNTDYVVSGIITPMDDSQIKELDVYGRFLTEDERLLEKLKPSMDEVRKAEQTIELLLLLQEVM